MSLFRSIKNLFRGKADELADALADPVRDGKLAIKDSEKQIEGFTNQIAKVMAETKKLEKDLANSKKDSEKWMEVAKNAAAAGDEDAARHALEKKQMAEQRVQTLTVEVDKSQKLVAQLREQLNNSKARLSKAKNNLSRLEARSSAAEIRKEFAKAQTDFNSNRDGLAALDDLEKAVNSEEAEAEAFEELAGSTEEAKSEDILAKYSQPTSEVDDELAALMASSKK